MLTALKEIINPNTIINYDTASNVLKLKEEGIDSKVAVLHISHIPKDALAFTLDHQPKKDAQKYKQLSLYVSSTNNTGVNKGCDLIVLWQENKKNKALVFDLKSDRPKASATEKQLNNSELFLNYLISMAKEHYGKSNGIFEINKAIVTTNPRGVNKRATYQPNTQQIKRHSYKVQNVNPSSSRSAKISFRQLVTV